MTRDGELGDETKASSSLRAFASGVLRRALGPATRLWTVVRQNFWFIPTMLSLIATVVALGLLTANVIVVDSGVGDIWFRMSRESARLALSTIAGSMITVASLVFSMTLVGLTTVSQQLGPRILLRFMDDRPTQITLGLFLATFLFALILLLGIADDGSGLVAGFAVVAAAVLSVASMGMMIHFFDHVAKRIQADVLIAELGSDLERAARAAVDPSGHSHAFSAPRDDDDLDRIFKERRVEVLSAARSGYVPPILGLGLANIGARHDVVFRAVRNPGRYVLAGAPLIEVALPQQVPDAVRETLSEADRSHIDILSEAVERVFHIRPQRARGASIDYEIQALVEVALRALSPGVNDPFTAVACLDALSSGIAILSKRSGVRRVLRDAEDTIRVVQAEDELGIDFDRAFKPILAAAGGDAIVVGHVRVLLDQLEEVIDNPAYLERIANLRTTLEAPESSARTGA